ncbi:MAG TPA: hypothetical protein VK168_08385 [Saprospiraceae bacterium]|nr:hypothetical protein [Saprospiraceae bacterium]
MKYQSFVTYFQQWFSPEQCRDLAVQLQEQERSVQWLVKSLVPVWRLLWQEKYLFAQAKPNFQAEQITDQLLLIWGQKPALTPALTAFSGVRPSSVQHLAPVVAHILGQWIVAEMATQSLDQYQKQCKRQRSEMETLVPQQVRSVLPELYAVPVVPKIENARRDLLLWLGSWMLLLAMALLFYYLLQKP